MPRGYPLHAWTPGWRIAAASVVGTSHVDQNNPCQDAHAVKVLLAPREGETLICVVADGAGSAVCGGEGAELLCGFLVDRVSELLRVGERITDLTWQQGLCWLDRFGAEIDALASDAGQDRRDYACTVLLAVVAQETAAFFQVGDGAIAIGFRNDTRGYHLPFWPERGMYANTTFFATDPSVADHLQAEIIQKQIDEVALFSDGVERLALCYRDCAVHDPFFLGLFPPVRRLKDRDAGDALLSDALARFLDSPRVNARTDDDKTLVLTTRRQPVEKDGEAEC